MDLYLQSRNFTHANAARLPQGKESEEYYQCDVCKGRTAATIYMRIHRFPRVLMLHVKRFRFVGE